MTTTKKLLYAWIVPSAALAVVACSPAMNGSLTQAGGDGPLVVDVDGSAPLVLSTANTPALETVVTVRGPNKGAGERGGVTGSFTGNGGSMCVVMDPSNKWEGSNDTANADPSASQDDGDSDLFVGLAANYTGIPGSKIGDFKADYTDSLGVAHEIDENVCVQKDLNGNVGAHAGSATPEFCTIATVAAAQYIVLAETVAPAPDTDTVKVALRVFPADCAAIGAIDENTLVGDNN